MKTPTEFYERLHPYENPENKIAQVTLEPTRVDFNGNYIFTIPYEENVFWTHYKFSFEDKKTHEIESEIVLHTFNDFQYRFKQLSLNPSEKWVSTGWPIPPIKTENQSKIELILYSHAPITVQLVGFKQLFPKTQNYILHTQTNKPQFVFSYHDNESGVMYNVENEYGIHDILDKSINVYPIDKYY